MQTIIPELGRSESSKRQSLVKQRFTLVLFFAAFILPVVVAYILLASGWWQKTGSVNNGALITPPVTLEPELHQRLAGSYETKPWLVLNILGDECSASCENALLLARQSAPLLGPDQTRVHMVVVYTKSLPHTLKKQLEGAFPTLHKVMLNETDLTALMTKLPELNPFNSSQQQHQQLLIVDPLGNAMLKHAVSADAKTAILEGKGFVKDLKRLLKLSRIG